ncbi:MAG: hypothetical protein ACXWVM_01260 [Polyangiales bacterium]
MDPKTEAAAKKLQTDAMDTDFLGLDFKKAKKKLDDAIKKCGKDKCSKPLVATLQRDLGIVLINSGDGGAGAKAFAAAFLADPNVSIAKDFLDNADVKKAWEAAKKKKGGGGGGEEGGGGGGGGGGDTSPPPAAEGGLIVKTTLAPVGYELPIVITAPSGLEVSAVKVSYKTDDMEKYRPLEAKKQSGKWVVILPCDITQKVGVIKLYAKAYDDGNSEIDHWGTIKKPAQIKLVDSMPDDVEAPTLPGGKDPKECREGGGGGGEGGNKPEGSGCKEDEECEKGLVCVENDAGKKWCKPGDKKPKSDEPKMWVGIDGQLDVVFLGAEKDLCKQSTWACSADNVTQFDPATGDVASIGRQDITTSSTQGVRVGETGGKTDGGAAFATKRIMASLDYFVAPRLSLGGRVGYAFGGNPTSSAKFVPLHLEARLQYFITDGPFRPYFLISGGYARMDPPVPNVIVEPNDPTFANACNQGGDPYANPQCGGSGTSRPVIKGVTAYKLVGPGFAAAGVGAWIMATNKIAVNLAAKFVFPVPVFAPTFAPEIGVKFGF